VVPAARLSSLAGRLLSRLFICCYSFFIRSYLGKSDYGRTVSSLNDELTAFITSQHVFFVATAPRECTGHVNVSPKGLETLRILSPSSIAYLDLTGSGVETIAHLNNNRRIVLMLCAFEGPPKIVRVHGRARAIPLGQAEFDYLRELFPDYPGARSVVKVEISRVAQSCGYGVPLFRYEGQRTQLRRWAESKGAEGLGKLSPEQE
jgi:Pyridoxamine 5'-phosphate oxidase